jgi:hypothetical protein
MNKLSNTNYCLIAILLVFILYLALQMVGIASFPRVWEDETWYANVAHNFSNGDGFINTNVGIGGGDDLFFYTFVLGVFYKIFGVSLLVSKLVSVLTGFLTLIGFYRIFTYLRIELRNTIFLLFIVIFSNVFYIAFRTIRPEAMVLMLTVWSVYFLLKTMDEHKLKYYYLIGLFSGFAFLSHPDGGLLGLSFGIYFLFVSIARKTAKPILIYAFGTVPAFLALFVNVVYFRDENIVVFFDNWLHRSSFKQTEGFLVNRFIILKGFILKYTLGIKRLYILLFEFATLVLGLLYYRKNKKLFIISCFGLGLFLLSLLVLSKMSTRGFGLITIFSIVALGLLLQEVKIKRKSYLVIIVLMAIYLANNLAGDLYFISKNYDNTSYSKLEDEIDKYVEDETKVYSYLCLWFPLKNNITYTNYTRWSKTEYQTLNKFLASDDVDYMIISDMITTGKTQTAGRNIKNKKLNANIDFYSRIRHYAMSHGTLIHTIPTKGYSTIEIWQCNRKNSEREREKSSNQEQSSGIK